MSLSELAAVISPAGSPMLFIIYSFIIIFHPYGLINISLIFVLFCLFVTYPLRVLVLDLYFTQGFKVHYFHEHERLLVINSDGHLH